jgi:hypothetical protein
MYKELFIFILLGTVSYILDIITAPKDYYTACIHKTSVHLEIWLHHILNMFSQFGWLCQSKTLLYVYLIAPIIVLIHWRTNNNQCFLTERINSTCNLQDNEMFRDWWSLLGLKKYSWYDSTHKFYLIIGWCIAVYRLNKMNQ